MDEREFNWRRASAVGGGGLNGNELTMVRFWVHYKYFISHLLSYLSHPAKERTLLLNVFVWICLIPSMFICVCMYLSVYICMCSLNLKTASQQAHLQLVLLQSVAQLSASLASALTQGELCRGCQNLIAKLVTGELIMTDKWHIKRLLSVMFYHLWIRCNIFYSINEVSAQLCA